jgi:hypothetical protein
MAQADRAPHSFKALQAQQYGDDVVRFCGIIHGSDTLCYGPSECGCGMLRRVKQRSFASGAHNLVSDLDATTMYSR